MTHGERHIADETLSAFIDQQLTPDEARDVRAHLEACLLCQSRLDDLESVVGLLHALPSVEPPRAVTLGPRLVSDPPNVIRLRRWYTFSRAGAASLAAAFVFLTAGALYVDSRPTQSGAGLASKAQPAAAPQLASSTLESAAPAPTAAPAARPRQAIPAPAAPTPGPAGAARSVAQPPQSPAAVSSTAADAADQTAAVTSVRSLPTPQPTRALRPPSSVPFVAGERASDVVDAGAPLRFAAALVGVLAVGCVLIALIVRHRLQAASASQFTE